MATKKKTGIAGDQILGAPDIKYEYVDVPEWGGAVRVKGLNGVESDAWEASLVTVTSTKGRRGSGVPELTPNMKNARARLVCLCLVDDDGNRLFTDDQVGELAAKSAAVLRRVFDVACRLSGIGDEVVEELEGN